MRRTQAALLAGLVLWVLPACHNMLVRPTFREEVRDQSASYALRSDLEPDARHELLAAAEAMRRELEAALPPEPGAGGAERREIVAFGGQDGFRKFLSAHVFAQGRAIGFYCDLGGECALAWPEPPMPEDRRVLRHELVHQHLAARLRGRLPAWLEEGLAERWALGVDAPPASLDGAPSEAAGVAGPAGEGSWPTYRARRLSGDAIFAALDVHGGLRSWPGREEERAVRVPPPAWAGGEGGYVEHLLFVRFLESIGEGREGALGRCLEAARRGERAELDLSHRFERLGRVEAAFHAFVLGEGRTALAAEREAQDDERRARVQRQIESMGATAAAGAGAPSTADGPRLARPGR